MAGDRDTAARDFFRIAFVERDVEAAYAMTSPVFRSVTDRDQCDVLLRAIHRVMGDYQDAQIRNYNANARAGTGGGTGTVHSLIYDATFVEGPATVHIQLRASESDSSSYQVEMFKVESPRFLNALAGDDPDTDDSDADDADSEPR